MLLCWSALAAHRIFGVSSFSAHNDDEPPYGANPKHYKLYVDTLGDLGNLSKHDLLPNICRAKYKSDEKIHKALVDVGLTSYEIDHDDVAVITLKVLQEAKKFVQGIHCILPPNRTERPAHCGRLTRQGGAINPPTPNGGPGKRQPCGALGLAGPLLIECQRCKPVRWPPRLPRPPKLSGSARFRAWATAVAICPVVGAGTDFVTVSVDVETSVSTRRSFQGCHPIRSASRPRPGSSRSTCRATARWRPPRLPNSTPDDGKKRRSNQPKIWPKIR